MQPLKIKEEKIFCIGRNKTGTTSMENVLNSFGYVTGNQTEAELFLEDWSRRDFSSIIEFCEHADAFQDIPFSLPYTYQALDAAFPGSKFILTVRDSAEQWYESLTRFHTKRVGKGRLATPGDFKKDPYCYKGFLWRAQELIYGATEATFHEKEMYMLNYNEHNKQVREYFKYRARQLLVLNLSDPQAMKILCDFLGHPWQGEHMPHRNKSE